jgi:hypothetical protein
MPIRKEYVSFEEARSFAHTKNLQTQKEWVAFSKSGEKPQNIPATPNWTYKNVGWQGWGDFLGTNTLATFNREYVSYEEARTYAQSLGFKGVEEWRACAKTKALPPHIPTNPYQTYVGKGWVSWIDFLGTAELKANKYLPFEEARSFARSQNLKSQKEWKAFVKSESIPQNIPATPQQFYAGKGWNGWWDFLGISGRINKYVDFEEARTYVHTLNLKTIEEWDTFSKSERKPHNIPYSPYQVYRHKGWNGWKDFLGTAVSKVVEREECLELH